MHSDLRGGSHTRSSGLGDLTTALLAKLRPTPEMGSEPPRVQAPELELSVVLPCLDEAETLVGCVEAARAALERAGIAGEVILADNGSRDGSRELAAAAGARIVEVEARGYGRAIAGGVRAARGRWVLIADADASYDLSELPRFVEALRAGHDLVQGCRLPAGGGRLLDGAMPPLHRWLGNPFFSWLARHGFRAPVHDVYCGMRAFRRELLDELAVRAPGMEFAPEMVIRAGRARVKIAEVGITLRPDGRKSHDGHLRTWRDGWRTLRLYLELGAEGVLAAAGRALLFGGLLPLVLALAAGAGWEPGAAVLVAASLATACGVQGLLLARLLRSRAAPAPPHDLERSLALAILLPAAGASLSAAGFSAAWIAAGATLAAIGVELALFALGRHALAGRGR